MGEGPTGAGENAVGATGASGVGELKGSGSVGATRGGCLPHGVCRRADRASPDAGGVGSTGRFSLVCDISST